MHTSRSELSRVQSRKLRRRKIRLWTTGTIAVALLIISISFIAFRHYTAAIDDGLPDRIIDDISHDQSDEPPDRTPDDAGESPPEAAQNEPPADIPPPIENEPITLGFVGDVMFSDNVELLLKKTGTITLMFM